MPRFRWASLCAFLRARLSPAGYLGLHLTIGLLALTGSLFLFGAIAEDVMAAERITRLDVQVSNWFHGHVAPLYTPFMQLVTDLHSTPGIIVLCLLLAFYWMRRKEWDWLLTLVLTVPVGMLLNVLLKNVFQRARPSFDDTLLTLSSYSFPSGHTAAATLFYGVLAAYLICRVKSWPWRAVIAMLAVLLVGLVGLSRIYLGAHYLSDVLAAMAAGSAWLAFSLTAAGTWRRRQMVLSDSRRSGKRKA
ncbi:MAG: phosphatase PAP2 family protein [Polaromonas sp.]